MTHRRRAAAVLAATLLLVAAQCGEPPDATDPAVGDAPVESEVAPDTTN